MRESGQGMADADAALSGDAREGDQGAEPTPPAEVSAPEEAPVEEPSAAAEASSGDEGEAEAEELGTQEEDSAPAADQPEPSITNPKMRWYVIHAYSGHENKVRTNLERAVQMAGMQDKVGRILVPVEKVTEMKDGKRSTVSRKSFPSYVLVEMEMTDEAWHLVTNTPGVTKFLGTGAQPQPLSKKEVDRILSHVEGTEEKPVPEVPYSVGDHVRVIDGPFTDFTGVVGEVNPERGKLKVMVSIFGRATPVELDFLQVKSL
jgi:transcriptional antiterminator NusG